MTEIQHGHETQALCLAAVRDHGPSLLSELAALTGLSRPTVTSVLSGFADSGLVALETDAAPAGARGGRPARRYTFQPHGGLVLGIDISTAEATVIVADLAGEIVAVSSDGFLSPDDSHPSLDRVVIAVEKTLAGAGRYLDEVRAVGLSVAGLVDTHGVLLGSPIIGEWENVAVGDRLAELLGVPVVMDNDLVLAATAEAAFGGLAQANVGLYALTWHEVSARITIKGSVLRGHHHRAGEVGLLRTFRDIPSPGGALVPAMHGVAQQLQRLRDDAADPEGLAAAHQLTASMTPGIAALLLAVDPDLVILGGPLAAFADVIAPMLSDSVRDFASGSFPLDATFTGGDFGPLAAPLGALYSAFSRFAEEIYSVAEVAPPPRLGLIRSP